MKIEYVKDGNVISIATARTGLKFPAVSQAEAYWQGLRNGRLMPQRSEVDPRGISGILDQAFILEKIAPGMAKIRLAGQSLNEILGMEMRGMPISSVFLPEARKDIQQALERLFDGPATVHMTLKSPGSFSRAPIEAQVFMAPLRDDNGRATRAFGAFQIKGGVDRAPRRFNIHKLEMNEILCENASKMPPFAHQGAFTPNENASRTKTDPHAIPGFSEHASGFSLRDQKAGSSEVKNHTHLRLVEND